MMAAGGHAAPGAQRAETYLRLQAEAELRTALGFPRYEQPRRSKVPARARYIAHTLQRSRRRAAAVRRFNQMQTRGRPGQPQAHADRTLAHRPGAVLRRSVSRVWQPVAPAWQWAVSRLWRLRRRLHARSGREHQPAPAQASLDRLAALAGALTGAGAIDEATAESVLVDLETSLAARRLIDDSALLGRPSFAGPQRGHGQLAHLGPLHAIPVGKTADCQLEDRAGRAYLGVMIVGSQSADLTVTARFPAPATERAIPKTARRAPHLMRTHLDQCTATDDRGSSYHAYFSGGSSDEEWEGTFHFTAVPPAGARWLDVTLPGAEPVRVDLTIPPTVLATAAASLPESGAADRYLDSLTADLLLSGWAEDPESDWEPDAVPAASGLLAAGVLVADSPALARLAAVAQRAERDLPAPLAGVRPAELPADWLSLLARRDSEDGPTGAIPVATALPELDGARCVITELCSESHSATMRVCARGWPVHRHFRMLPDEPFRWTARDDLGGWYLAEEHGGSSSSDGRAELQLRLHPAISPAARSLQIVLTSKTGEVSVTVPLDWQEGI
jgi:hypothetical protein